MFNRVRDEYYSDDVCSVVTEPYQFSWYNDSPIPKDTSQWEWFMDDMYHEVMSKEDKEEWINILRLSYSMYFSRGYYDNTGGALFYMTLAEFGRRGYTAWDDATPVAIVGNHVFFKRKRGFSYEDFALRYSDLRPVLGVRRF